MGSESAAAGAFRRADDRDDGGFARARVAARVGGAHRGRWRSCSSPSTVVEPPGPCAARCAGTRPLALGLAGPSHAACRCALPLLEWWSGDTPACRGGWRNLFRSASTPMREWKKFSRRRFPADVPRGAALSDIVDPWWTSMFEAHDPGATLRPVELRYPFFDVRLMSLALTLPSYPWCVNKEIARSAMRGALPEEVLVRPKSSLAADAGGCPWPVDASSGSGRDRSRARNGGVRRHSQVPLNSARRGSAHRRRARHAGRGISGDWLRCAARERPPRPAGGLIVDAADFCYSACGLTIASDAPIPGLRRSHQMLPVDLTISMHGETQVVMIALTRRSGT